MKTQTLEKLGRKLIISSASLVVASALPAQAGLLAYEGFDYAAGSVLADQNGGTGFSQAWQANIGSSGSVNNSMIFAGSFSYTDLFGNTLLTSGNLAHLTGDGTATGDNTGGNLANGQPLRGFSFSRGTTTDQTTWISLLAIRTGLADTPYTDAGGTV